MDHYSQVQLSQIYDPPEQNHFNISVSLSKYDGCAVFYMASMNSRSPLRPGEAHLLCIHFSHSGTPKHENLPIIPTRRAERRADSKSVS